MKKFFFLLVMVCSLGTLSAQNYISHLATIDYNGSFEHENLRIEFIKVISDSRCPRSVTCVWAGEAKVLVAIYDGKKLLEKKELIFDGSGRIDIQKNVLFSNEDIRIIGVSLYPYPESPDEIPKEAYSLEIKIN